MSKKTFNSEDSKSIDKLTEVEAAKKQEITSTESIIDALRSDMHLISDASPEKKSILERLNLKYLFGILLTLFIIVLAWYMIGGPGRPILEHNLVILVHTSATPTHEVTPSLVPVTNTPPQPSSTPLPSPTLHPSSTPTVRPAASPTMQTPTTTSTAASTCRDALTITLTDVGQTLCVKGVVIETIERPNAFMVIFSDVPESFYWVSYDMVWSKAELDTCYQTTGTIKQLGNRPIMLFGYSNIPEICP